MSVAGQRRSPMDAVILRRVAEGARPYEIADELGVASNNIHSRISRMRQRGDMPPSTGERLPMPRERAPRKASVPKQPPNTVTIACLRCARPFGSWSRAANRICSLCKNSETWG